MTKNYTASKLGLSNEVIWVSGVSREDWEVYKEVQLALDAEDGGVLFEGMVIVGHDPNNPISAVFLTESDHPTLAMFGWIEEWFGGSMFFDLKFFELTAVPQAREVGIWEADRDDYRQIDHYDWDRWFEILDAISRAWTYPTWTEEEY